MPFPPKKSIQAFAKKAATPPLAASMLAKKRALAPPHPPPAAPPPAVPGAVAAPPAAVPVAVAPPAVAPPAAPPAPAGDQLMNMSEMLEEAAQEAETQANPELEDLIAGYTLSDTDPMQAPEWAADTELWEHVAKTVGLDVPELSARYEEPFAVAAYLYAKMGGPLNKPEESESGEGGGADMDQPGTAAKAMSAVMKSKPKVPAPAPPQ